MSKTENLRELNKLSLPGYGHPARLDRIVPEAGNVFAALIAARDPETEAVSLLTSARQPDVANPWDIGLPSCRIGAEQMAAILAARNNFERKREEPVLIPKVRIQEEGERLSRHNQTVRTYTPNAEVIQAGASPEESRLVTTARFVLEHKLGMDLRQGDMQRQVGAVSLHEIRVGLMGSEELGAVEYGVTALAVVSLHDYASVPLSTIDHPDNAWVVPAEHWRDNALLPDDLMDIARHLTL
jgi:hypothetical protein